jgi:hypothetical protein
LQERCNVFRIDRRREWVRSVASGRESIGHKTRRIDSASVAAKPLHHQAVVEPRVGCAVAELSKPGVEARPVEIVCASLREESTEPPEDPLVA